MDVFIIASVLIYQVAAQAKYGYYYGYNAGLTWEESRAACEALGLRLAVFETNSDWNRAQDYIRQYDLLYNSDGHHFWIGLKYEIATSQHTFMDGSILTFVDAWDDSHPKDVTTKQCARAQHDSNLLWRSNECTKESDYLCEGYLYVPSTKTQPEAKEECEKEGGTLAILKTDERFNAGIQHITVMVNMEGFSQSDVFIGAEYDVTEGKFVHFDGTTTDAFGSLSSGTGVYPWYNYEPNAIGSQNCLRLFADTYRWRTTPCSDSHSYLCMKDTEVVTTTTTTSTTTSNPTTTTSTSTATTPTTTTPTTTTPKISTSTTTVKPTKPWWFVEYGADGLAIGNNGKSFKDSTPPAKSGIIGLAIGFASFLVLISILCVCWFRCCRNYKDERRLLDDSMEEKKKVPDKFEPVLDKPHGLKYYA